MGFAYLAASGALTLCARRCPRRRWGLGTAAAAGRIGPISARCIQKGWPPLYPGYAAAAARVGPCRSRGGGEDRECFGFLTPTACSCRLAAAAAGSVEANTPLEASASAAAGTPVEASARVGAGAPVKAGTVVRGCSGRLRISTGGDTWWYCVTTRAGMSGMTVAGGGWYAAKPGLKP